MQAVLVDSNVLIAAVSSRDRHHEEALAIVKGADSEELPLLRVPNYVLAETLNYVAEHAQRSAANDLYDRLEESTGFEFVRATRRDDRRAIERFRTSDVLSYADAAIGAYADRTEMEYCYSFDDDIDALDGVSRLDQPLDPYAPE